MDWFDYTEIKRQFSGAKPVDLAEENFSAITALNLMEGRLDWAQVEPVLQYLDVGNYEVVIDQILEVINLKKLLHNVQNNS